MDPRSRRTITLAALLGLVVMVAVVSALHR
jgi:hypothetical protein